MGNQKSDIKKNEESNRQEKTDVKGAGSHSAASGEFLDRALQFCKTHTYQVISTAACVVLLIVLIASLQGRSGAGGQTDTEISPTEALAGLDEEYQRDAYPEINELMAKYYEAYAAGDTETLATLADPLSDSEKSYISVFSQYVEEYRNLACYTKSGLEDGSYVVSAYTEVKLKDVDTVAPGLERFYLKKNESGALVIDNVYGQFNTKSKEYDKDAEVESFLEEFGNQADVVKLLGEVQEKYEEALAADENLKTMVETTVPDAMTVWASDRATAAKKAEEEKKAAEEAAKKAAEEEAAKKAEEEKKAAELAAAVAVYATDKVNVRAKAGETEEVIGKLERGAQTTRLEDKDGWSRIDYSNGQQGYVKSEFLSTEKPADQAPEEGGEEPASSAQTASGDVVELKDSVNIRKSMSTDSDKIATAFPGEKVTVIESYAEGWTKVTYGDKTGYVKTELLQ